MPLFRRMLEGGGRAAVTARRTRTEADDKCRDDETTRIGDRKGDLVPTTKGGDECRDLHLLEEAMRVVIIGLLSWVIVTYAGVIMPSSMNSLLSSGSIYPPRMYEYPFPSPQVLKKLPPVNDAKLNASLGFGQVAINSLQRLEENLKHAGITISKGTPEHGQLIENYPSEEALLLQRMSWAITRASMHLSYLHCGRFGVSDDECASYISTLSLQNTGLGATCTAFNHPKCSDKKYRSYDGSCNNPKRGSWGKALTGFKRLLHPKYADGFEQPRISTSKKPLPPARMVSSSIASDIDAPDSKHTLALMQWSQFLEHDLVQIPIRKMVHSDNSISCCDRWGNTLPPRYQHPSCAAMSVSKNDPAYGPQWIDCLSYTKSVTTFRSDCTFGAAEQMNQATHYLDSSQIYGSTPKEAQSLRENRGGAMKVSKSPAGLFLPLVESPEKSEKCIEGEKCFKAGDSRVNAHPHLTAMHVLWLREHNRIARRLAELNPTWNDEVLYQEARRIVVAEIQHITYADWLPELTGHNFDKELDLSDVGYSTEVDPSVSNSLATAGLRFFSSLLDGTVHLINEDRTLNTTLELVDHFNRPRVITEPDKYEQLVRGMVSQHSQTMDLHIVDDVTNKLYKSTNQKLGLDILSFDIQRGREHGLPAYNQYRRLCGLQHAKDFDDLGDSMPEKTVAQLKSLYADVNDIDLIVGALAEKPKGDSVIGPTFSCLLVEQLVRSRSSDKYFYTNVDQPEPFNEQQLTQLKKASLARIICDNVPEIRAMQKDVFSVVSESNPLKSCESGEIKRVNLVAWQDPSNKPDLITRTKMNVDKWMKNNV